MSPNEEAQQAPEQFDHSSIGLASLLSFLLAISLGVFGAVVIMPSWMPNLAQSLTGPSPKGYWYLARGAAFVAIGLLWLSMAIGLLITDKMAKTWPGSGAAFAIHEHVSLLGLGFAIFHALILMGDKYIGYTLAQVLTPFGSVNYRPVWVSLGQVGFYVWAIVAGTFYIRHLIGPKTWRFIHFASFFTFMIAMFHGIQSGTDSPTTWAQWIYWGMGGSLVFLVVYRLLASAFPPKAPAPKPRKTTPASPPSAPPSEAES